jgi:hypothetical protein
MPITPSMCPRTVFRRSRASCWYSGSMPNSVAVAARCDRSDSPRTAQARRGQWRGSWLNRRWATAAVQDRRRPVGQYQMAGGWVGRIAHRMAGDVCQGLAGRAASVQARVARPPLSTRAEGRSQRSNSISSAAATGKRSHAGHDVGHRPSSQEASGSWAEDMARDHASHRVDVIHQQRIFVHVA